MKSEQLSKDLRESRVKRQEEDKSFMIELERSQNACLEKEKSAWNEFTAEKTANKSEYLR